MKPNHRHLSIGPRLALGVLIPLSLATCAVWITSDRSGAAHHERTETALREQLDATRWSSSLALEAQRERTIELELAATPDEEHRNQLGLALERQRQKIQHALNMTPQAQATQSTAEMRQFDAVRSAFIAYWEQAETKGETPSKADGRVAWDRLQLALSRWQQTQEAERHAATSTAVEGGLLSANAQTALATFLLLCAFGYGLTMLTSNVRTVRRPLKEARLAIDALARGDYQRRVRIERLDEAGDVLVALDDLSNYLAVMLPDDEMAMDASFDHVVEQLRTSATGLGADMAEMVPMTAPPPPQSQPQKTPQIPTMAMGTTARA